jgi:hypothetical protein
MDESFSAARVFLASFFAASASLFAISVSFFAASASFSESASWAKH